MTGLFSRHVTSTLVVAAVLVASCGSDDDPSGSAGRADEEPATLVPTSPSDHSAGSSPRDTVEDSTSASGESTGEQLVVVGPDQVAPECLDALVTFLQAIEPSAEGIDWSGTDLVDQETDMFFVAVEDASEEFSLKASVCDDVDVNLIEGAEIELLLQIARDEAPGVAPWLEFLRDLAASQE